MKGVVIRPEDDLNRAVCYRSACALLADNKRSLQISNYRRQTMDYNADIESQHKCAHKQCRCQIPSAQKYCSDYCANAEEVDEVKLQCQCKHKACALD